ncbi:TIGR04219 family outer membrane beta-barrel protein [Marinobacter sp.]|uniref:TIGR04219 family outer membrane beta-barrel protein n=1 Tax=Marinobacter sp. TaxID=50741 RepID=UPI00384CB3FE
MRKLILAAGTSAAFIAPFLAPLASADVLGVGANVSYWSSDLSGEAESDGSVVDVENDLDLESDDNVNFTAHFEHPVPALPNVRFNYTSLSLSGRGELGVDGFDTIVTPQAQVDSELDLDQIDVTLYYEVLDNWVNLDLGLTGRSLDGELTVQEVGGTAASETEIKAVVPMAYIAARFDLPLTGVSVGAEGNVISFDGDSVYDFNAYGQYEIQVVQLRAGYRQLGIDYEDDDDTLDIEIGGPFVSAGLVF